jgi:transposase
MIDVTELAGIVFSGLSALVIEDVEDAGDVVVVRAGTRGEPVACPGCGSETARVHGYHERTPADVPVGGRRVLVKVRVRRMRCPVLGCAVQTFREQVPGVLERYQRRTGRLNGQVSAVARELAGRAGARLLAVLGIDLSRHSALRALLRIALPDLEVPRVLGIDDFALRRGLVYATILIDAETGRRVDVLEGRTADVVEEWLRAHPGVEIVTRDGSGAYGEAVRSALPEAVQVSDRWHLWHGLAEAAWKDVAAHSACWAEAEGIPLQEGRRAGTTTERWQQVHDLRAQGVGLADCARRLGLAMNTVKRYDKADKPGKLRRAARYRPTMVDPYRGYLRKRRSEKPGVPVRQLLREIRGLGYPGSSNLLVRYLNQGRADAPRPHLSPRKAVQLLLSKPDNLNDSQRETAARLSSSCPEMKALASLTGSFAALLVPDPANEEGLVHWIAGARAADLPNLHSFTRGLDLDIKAATAALTLPHHNGRTEGVNCKTKMLKRQMSGRAGFGLLRHRILLGLGHGSSPPELRQSLSNYSPGRDKTLRDVKGLRPPRKGSRQLAPRRGSEIAPRGGEHGGAAEGRAALPPPLADLGETGARAVLARHPAPVR